MEHKTPTTNKKYVSRKHSRWLLWLTNVFNSELEQPVIYIILKINLTVLNKSLLGMVTFLRMDLLLNLWNLSYWTCSNELGMPMFLYWPLQTTELLCNLRGSLDVIYFSAKKTY